MATKAESLVALFAVFLLGLTSVGILYEAFQKIFGPPGVPDVTPWSFGVRLFALAVDLSRSRYLARVARETHSPALDMYTPTLLDVPVDHTKNMKLGLVAGG